MCPTSLNTIDDEQRHYQPYELIYQILVDTDFFFDDTDDPGCHDDWVCDILYAAIQLSANDTIS